MSFSESAASCEEPAVFNPKPFLKWAGGKTQLLPAILKRLPKKYNRYLEAFVGGGAVFFNLAREFSYISDVNHDLINCYKVVASQADELIEELSSYEYSKEFFYQIREIDRTPAYQHMSPVKRAARLIYLNRTCFNGLYRVNSKGNFNVPFGDYKNPKIVDRENIFACSNLLKNTEIALADFLEIENVSRSGDFVYFDPPYLPLNKTSSFTAYAKEGFGEDKQVELKELCCRLSEKGVLWMLSNSSNPLIYELYKDFNLSEVPARRNINSIANLRGDILEVLVTNY